MFGINAYTEVINSFKDNGFTFKKFLEKHSPKSIYLRHDIDFSVQDAVNIAQLEKEIGIVSNYFFMLTSNTYNLLSEVNQSRVRLIKSLGHEVSLHFDPTSHKNMECGFQSERMIFNQMFETDIQMISIHRPGDFLNSNKVLNNCRHTYEDEFFKNMDYVSDSGGRDIKSVLLDHSKIQPDYPLHLLIHPIWWTTDSANPTETLGNWMELHCTFLSEETKKNCKTFRG